MNYMIYKIKMRKIYPVFVREKYGTADSAMSEASQNFCSKDKYLTIPELSEIKYKYFIRSIQSHGFDSCQQKEESLSEYAHLLIIQPPFIFIGAITILRSETHKRQVCLELKGYYYIES